MKNIVTLILSNNYNRDHILLIASSIYFSAAIEISGTMGVDAIMAKTGVKMTNTLHTSTMTTANIQLQNGEILSMNFDTPREKIEVFTAQ